MSRPRERPAGERGRGTVIRYDISRDAASAIEWHMSLGHSPEVAFDGKEAYLAERWTGRFTPPWVCLSFAVRLPGDVAWMVRLLRLCLAAGTDESPLAGPHGGKKVAASLRRQGVKLRWDLALPGGSPSCPQELAFVEAALAGGGDLAAWHAYADWLQERGHSDAADAADAARRGTRMTHWLWGRPRKKGEART